MASPTTVDVNLLLAHERWAARLARALVRDDDLAEDIVQEARVSFWRRGPTEATHARSWLGVVVRNLVRGQHRVHQRQTRVANALAADAQPVPSAEDMARRLEGHRLLAELVGQLRQPFREVIVLRYYEGLTAAAIARRLGVPAGTVRWRMKTALDDLRATLDRRHGGRREGWMVVMAGLASREPVATGGAPAAARPATNSGVGPLIRVVAPAGALAAAALALLAVRARPPAQEAGVAVTPERAAPERASAANRPPAFATGAATGEPARANEGDIPAWAQQPGFPHRAIAGRVLADGQPVAGAALRLSSGMLTHARALDRHATSGADGSFGFAPQPPTNWFLTVSAPDRVPQVLYVDLRATEPRIKPRDEAPDRLTIELAPCRLFVSGQVRDPAGNAIAGARVKLTAKWNNGGTEVVTEASGRYRMCVPAGSKDLTLVAEGDGWGAVETLAFVQQSRDIDFTLEPEATVSGRALRADGITGVPGAKVTLGLAAPANPNNPPILGTQPVRLETVTDQQGRFEIRGLAAGTFRVQAVSNDLKSEEAASHITVAAGERRRDVAIVLVETTLVEGTVLREGRAVPDVNLAFDVRGTPVVPEGHHVLYPFARSGPGGRYQVRLKRGAVVDRVLGPWPRKLAPAGFVARGAHMTGVDLNIP